MSTRSARYGTLDLHTPKGRMLSGVDRDAAAFLEAAQIFNTRQQQAIFELVGNMKRYGLWSKMLAVYPFVGGDATAHKWNLKDPRDLNAAFRLAFLGGITHNEMGAQGNGSNGYARTYLNHQDKLGRDSVHVSIYTNTISTTGIIPIGTFGVNAGLNAFTFIAIATTTGTTSEGQANGAGYDPETFTDTVKRGFYMVSRTLSTEYTIYRNDTAMGTELNNSAAYTDDLARDIYLFAFNNTGSGTGDDYNSDARVGFATIGLGLTSDDARNLNNITQLFQRRLGRAV